jgi:hypothetical protein
LLAYTPDITSSKFLIPLCPSISGFEFKYSIHLNNISEFIFSCRKPITPPLQSLSG